MSQIFASQHELEEFAACFSVNGDHKDLRSRIKRLPKHLRYSKGDLILHKTGYRENDRYIHMDRPSCSVHKWIDSIAVSVIFDSLQTELTRAVEYIYINEYLAALGPDEIVTLHRLAAIQEMWTKPGPDTVQNRRWKYQIDQCEACMLSRIATYPSALRELRTLFLVMHPTKNLYRPLILIFVDEWINLTDQWKAFFEMSEERAKEIEKCIKHWKIHKGVEAEAEEEHDEAKEQQFKNADGLETLPARSYKPTPSLSQAIPSPLFSSTLNRPLSRNEYELSESEFLREFSPKMTFYRMSSIEDDSSPDITDIYSQDNDTRTSLGLGRTIAVLQKEQILHQYRDGRETPNGGLSSRLYSPWSSTDELRESYSGLSQTTVSSPSYSVRRENTSPPISPLENSNPKTPDRYSQTPVSPLANPKTPDRYIPPPKTPKSADRIRTLLTIPEVSPFHVSPFVSASSSSSSSYSSYSSSQNIRPSSSRAYTSAVSPAYSSDSTWSPSEEEVETRVTMRREQPRVVHVRAARERYIPK